MNSLQKQRLKLWESNLEKLNLKQFLFAPWLREWF